MDRQKDGKEVWARRIMKHKVRFNMWLTAWLALACAIVVILTFCHYQPDWDLKFWLKDTKERGAVG